MPFHSTPVTSKILPSLTTTLVLGLVLGVPAASRCAPQTNTPTSKPAAPAKSPAVKPGDAHSPAQPPPQAKPDNANIDIRALADRVIATQHHDDEAFDEYERIEHQTMFAGFDHHVTDERVFRVVPTGSGTLKLLLREGHTPVDASVYRKELHDWQQILEIASNPNDSRQQAAYAKQQKKQKERAGLVDAARRAFRVSLAAQETRDGKRIDTIQIEPNPEFQPHSLAESVFPHARAKLWIDDATGQIIRGEGDIISDVWIGGGILGKLYRGGHFTLENAEVSPGLWLPSRIQYDYSGRKFLFVFEQHEVTEYSHYRRVGPPKEALAMVRDEVAHGSAPPADP
jgi:hypothetical protein